MSRTERPGLEEGATAADREKSERIWGSVNPLRPAGTTGLDDTGVTPETVDVSQVGMNTNGKSPDEMSEAARSEMFERTWGSNLPPSPSNKI